MMGMVLEMFVCLLLQPPYMANGWREFIAVTTKGSDC